MKSGDTLRVGRVEFTFVDAPIFRAYVLDEVSGRPGRIGRTGVEAHEIVDDG